MLSRDRASEELFRALAPSFNFVHLATHGFFAPPIAQSTETFAQMLDIQLSAAEVSKDAIVHATDLGLLSGVVFSGANQPPQAEHDDGILTSTEIAMLPLQKTSLVVLSACETGLGEIAAGEGLLGVQRAFQVAGARSVVASLWSVPDEETRQLMERFYYNLWSRQLSAVDALREAQLWMLSGAGSERSRLNTATANRGEHDMEDDDSAMTTRPDRRNPYYWAAFQLSGDWR